MVAATRNEYLGVAPREVNGDQHPCRTTQQDVEARTPDPRRLFSVPIVAKPAYFIPRDREQLPRSRIFRFGGRCHYPLHRHFRSAP